jgi:serine/threonine-protein kinase RsbW
MAATTVRLTLESDVRLVDIVHSASETMAHLAGFDEDDALNVGIAVREAVINAMRHGNQADRAKKVGVVLQATGNSVKARVKDQGVGFDPHATADPTAGDNVLNTSGRGLLLIRAFVDKVDFKFREGRGMEVTLFKKRTARKPKTILASARP